MEGLLASRDPGRRDRERRGGFPWLLTTAVVQHAGCVSVPWSMAERLERVLDYIESLVLPYTHYALGRRVARDGNDIHRFRVHARPSPARICEQVPSAITRYWVYTVHLWWVPMHRSELTSIPIHTHPYPSIPTPTLGRYIPIYLGCGRSDGCHPCTG